jgi:hypothetical protein
LENAVAPFSKWEKDVPTFYLIHVEGLEYSLILIPFNACSLNLFVGLPGAAQDFAEIQGKIVGFASNLSCSCIQSNHL